MWYPRHKLYYRIAMFWGGATIAGSLTVNAYGIGLRAHNVVEGAFSGLLAFGISFMSGTEGKLGWSWIFVSCRCSPMPSVLYACE